MTSAGFPHSGTAGSKHVCCSPTRFAAYCALHRLFAPRHPPYALCSLTKPIIQVGSRQSKVKSPKTTTTTTTTPNRSLRLRMRTHYHIQLDNEQHSALTEERLLPTYAGAEICYSFAGNTCIDHQKAFCRVLSDSLAHKKGKTARLPLAGSTYLSRQPLFACVHVR